MIDIIGLYEGLMLQASFAGIGFWVVDSRDEAGRRVKRFLFPGQDNPQYQDLGQEDGEIVINGLYLGDDYSNIATRLRAAFQTAGPATLVHPWLGSIQVVQAPGKPPKFEFKQDELRVLRFTATFVLWKARPKYSPDTLTGLLNALENVRTAALGLLTTVLAPVAITLMAIGYVESLASAIGSIFTGLTGGATNAAVQPAALTPIAALSTVNTLTPDTTYPAEVAAALGAVSAAIAATSAPTQAAAVAPGGSTTAPTAVDGRITANLILSAVSAMAVHASDPAPGPMITLAAEMLALADAIQAASTIDFDSQQEAMQWLTKLLAALIALAKQAAALAVSEPTAAGSAWRSLEASKAALSDDMNALIGRLPSVTTFTAPTSVPVWLLAQYLAGDAPDTVVAVYLDLVQRNQILNPAVAPAGPLEVLL